MNKQISVAGSKRLCVILSLAIVLSSAVTTTELQSPRDRHLRKRATPLTPRKKRFVTTERPLQTKVRTFDSSIVNGYNSCFDLRDDIVNALKYYSNSIIVSEKEYDWYEDCNPNEPALSWANGYGGNVRYKGARSVGSSGDSKGSAPVLEDSYDTNIQVEGVDEADIVKSDGTHVFAAYDGKVYAWDAHDGKGTSVTIIDDKTEEASNDAQSKRVVIQETPKTRIHSLLLHGRRLAVISSYQDYYNRHYDSTPKEPTVDTSELSIRVYDISKVPNDGSELTLLGKKTLKGSYEDARTIDSSGVVISSSYINSLTEELYRHQRRYCGLDAAAYEKKAAKFAMRKARQFANNLISELGLQDDCRNIYQVRATEPDEDGFVDNTLNRFAQVVSFDMSADFTGGDIPIQSAGAFTGYLHSIYASQNFVAAISVMNDSTHVLGFDIGGAAPEPFSYGVVEGSPLNQYSIDLYNDNLRIATTSYDWSQDNDWTTNRITILKLPRGLGKSVSYKRRHGSKRSSGMSIIGMTGHLGKKNEDIYAVRFIGDKAYVVTFMNTDPFLIVDLADPKDPKVVGQLEASAFGMIIFC